MNQQRRNVEVHVAALADECAAPPMSRSLQRKFARGGCPRAVDARLAALPARDGENALERRRVGRERVVDEPEF